jgi:hypothetical protein
MKINGMQSCTAKRVYSFLELELKLCPVSLEWLKENLPKYDLFLNNFIEAEGYEQAGAMHNSAYSDGQYCAFYNYNKLDGNPFLLEKKETYCIDDVWAICHKLGFPVDKGIEYCFEIPVEEQNGMSIF